MENHRITNNRHDIYPGKIKILIDWLKSFPDLKAESLDGDKLILPLPVSTVEMFFVNVVVKGATEDIRMTVETRGKSSKESRQ